MNYLFNREHTCPNVLYGKEWVPPTACHKFEIHDADRHVPTPSWCTAPRGDRNGIPIRMQPNLCRTARGRKILVLRDELYSSSSSEATNQPKVELLSNPARTLFHSLSSWPFSFHNQPTFSSNRSSKGSVVEMSHTIRVQLRRRFHGRRTATVTSTLESLSDLRIILNRESYLSYSQST